MRIEYPLPNLSGRINRHIRTATNNSLRGGTRGSDSDELVDIGLRTGGWTGQARGTGW